MKPPSISLEQVAELDVVYRTVIPPEYEDENGHMNMRWYLALYDEAWYPVAAQFGVTDDYRKAHQVGGFDLEHHIHYLREVMIGDEVSITVRLVNRTEKRVHYLMFMVNESRGVLASIFECVNSFGDMAARRTVPFPPEIAAAIDEMLARHQALAWEPPVCGVMGA